VLNAVRCHIMDAALFKEFCDEFTRKMNRLRMEGLANGKANFNFHRAHIASTIYLRAPY
jgi:hypothetical protein